MANLKDLRVRISSVKSTRKITSAMKMVAASRLRKAHEACTKSEIYATAMKMVLTNLVKSLAERQEKWFVQGKGVIRPPMMLIGRKNPKKQKTHLIIAITSDKGLCGAFNMNICKRVAGIIMEMEKQGDKVKLLCVGKKGFELLRRDFGDAIVAKFTGVGSKHGIAYSEAEDIVFKAVSLFERGEIDTCSVLFNHFKSAISQDVQLDKLFPLKDFLEVNPWEHLTEMDLLTASAGDDYANDDNLPSEDEWNLSSLSLKSDDNSVSQELDSAVNRYSVREQDSHTGRSSGSWAPAGGAANNKKNHTKMAIPPSLAGLKPSEVDLDALKSKYPPFLYDYEPSDLALLERAIPRYVVMIVYRALVESLASENGARMTSMDNATRNAGDMIDSLTLMYNRTRQGLITTELVEIISGAESV